MFAANKNDSEVSRLLMKLDEASDALSVSPAMLRKLVRSGQLEVVRIGRAVRVPKRELMRLCGAVDQTEAKQ